MTVQSHMRKFLAVAVLVPLAVIIVIFAVANREIVTISLDPLTPLIRLSR